MESDGKALKLVRYWMMVVYLSTRSKGVYGGKFGRGEEPGESEARCVTAEMVNINAQNRL